MGIDDYIYESIFSEKPKFYVFYSLVWEQFKEDGFVITDEAGKEVDCVFKAVAIQNIIGEFVYRLYDEVNETDYEDVISSLEAAGYSLDDILDYCDESPDIFCEEDSGATVKNALDYTTEITADKLLELFSADDLFDYIFSATYEFEQDFTFAFEDVDEFQAFVDSNSDRLDEYKETYPAVMQWIEQGMIV